MIFLVVVFVDKFVVTDSNRQSQENLVQSLVYAFRLDLGEEEFRKGSVFILSSPFVILSNPAPISAIWLKPTLRSSTFLYKTTMISFS